MKTIVIAGGNSGIGRQAAHDLLARGHRLVLIGRDPEKGNAALASFGDSRDRASFLPADLSTHDGVRAAARHVLAVHDRIDALIHSTGFLATRESRTADGLHPSFAVNYLSRYHLTQLLLPALRRGEHPRAVMVCAAFPPTDAADFARFPRFEPYDFKRDRKPTQLANHHYAAHLTRTEPGLAAGVVNAGAAKTDILRNAPWHLRATAKLFGPVIYNSLETSAHNLVEAALHDDWDAPVFWGKAGHFDQRTPIALGTATTKHLMAVSATLTGA